MDLTLADLPPRERYRLLIGLLISRPLGRLFACRYRTTCQRFDLPGDLPE